MLYISISFHPFLFINVINNNGAVCHSYMYLFYGKCEQEMRCISWLLTLTTKRDDVLAFVLETIKKKSFKVSWWIASGGTKERGLHIKSYIS